VSTRAVVEVAAVRSLAALLGLGAFGGSMVPPRWLANVLASHRLGVQVSARLPDVQRAPPSLAFSPLLPNSLVSPSMKGLKGAPGRGRVEVVDFQPNHPLNRTQQVLATNTLQLTRLNIIAPGQRRGQLGRLASVRYAALAPL
jgi:hypothetical protein